MILVKTWDTDDGGVGFELSGHSTPGEGFEHNLVCASASMLLVTLSAITNGNWGGEGSGGASCTVPFGQLSHAEFVLVGLMLLEETYEGQVTFERKDTRLGAEWKKADEWAKQHR